MPAELFQWANGKPRVDLDRLMPEFRDRVFVALASARARGQRYYATRGFATWWEQHQLRLAHLRGGPRAAPAGLSAHEYGIAFDFAADGSPKPGLQPVWNDAAYDILGEEVQRVGLVWGASFRDRPHVQWPEFVTGAQLKPLQNILRGRNDMTLLRECWDYILVNTSPLPELT